MLYIPTPNEKLAHIVNSDFNKMSLDELAIAAIRDAGNTYLYGEFVIDEVRISNVVRSTGWIATEYNNQYDPKSFYSVSGRFELDPPIPEDFNYYKIITIDSDEVSGSNDLINFPLLMNPTRSHTFSTKAIS